MHGLVGCLEFLFCACRRVPAGGDYCRHLLGRCIALPTPIVIMDRVEMRRIIPADQLSALAGLAAIAFLVLAPIYRFPAVPGQVIALVKLALFFGAVALSAVFLWARRDLADAFKIAATFAVVLVSASVVGLVQSDTLGIIRHLQTIALPVLSLLIGFASWRYFAEQGLRYYAIAMTAVAAVGWLCSALLYHDVGGLAYLRTGWSGSLAYASVIALAFMGLSSSARSVALWGGCYAIIASSQLYLGGRAGLLFPIAASLIVLMFGFLGPRCRNSTLVVAIFLAISLGSTTSFLSSFRVATENDDGRYVNVMDKITSGRLGLIYEALDLIEQRPLTGWGFTDHRKTGLWKSESIVHNEWLKAWYQGGPLYLAGVAFVFLSLAFFAWRADHLSAITGFPPVFTVIVLCQLFTSMVEPNSIIGVFYKSSPFWILMGAATWIAIRYGQEFEQKSVEAA